MWETWIYNETIIDTSITHSMVQLLCGSMSTLVVQLLTVLHYWIGYWISWPSWCNLLNSSNLFFIDYLNSNCCLIMAKFWPVWVVGYWCCTASEEQNTHTPDKWQQGRGDGERRGSVSSEISEESVKPPPSSQSKIVVSVLQFLHVRHSDKLRRN